MPKFVDELRPGMDGVRQTLLAREGGYAVDLEMIVDGEAEWVDMTCEHEGEQLLVRLFADPSQIVFGAKKVRLLNVQGVLLDQDGRLTEPPREVEALITLWAEATDSLQPCGWIQLWRLPRRPVKKGKTSNGCR